MNLPVLLLITSLLSSVGAYREITKGESTALQSFEGCITFRIEVEALRPEEMSEEMLKAQFGEAVTRCYKDGDYHWTYEGGKVSEVWYHWRDEREYALLRGENVIRVIDVTKPMLSVVELVEEESDETVLSMSVRVFTMNFSDRSTNRFWVSEEVPVNPDYFVAYRTAAQDVFYSTAKALPLKYERQTKLYRREETATAISVDALSSHTFELPDLPMRDWE